MTMVEGYAGLRGVNRWRSVGGYLQMLFNVMVLPKLRFYLLPAPPLRAAFYDGAVVTVRGVSMSGFSSRIL